MKQRDFEHLLFDTRKSGVILTFINHIPIKSLLIKLIVGLCL